MPWTAFFEVPFNDTLPNDDVARCNLDPAFLGSPTDKQRKEGI